MFSSLIFGGTSRPAGDEQMSRPSSSLSSARLSAVLAMHDADSANRSPVLRSTTTADNKAAFTASDSTASVGSKIVKSPMLGTPASVTDENRAPMDADTSADRSMEDVFHTPIIAAGSEVSLKFAESNISSLSQSVRAKQKNMYGESAEASSPGLLVHQGHIEPLGVPAPSTYADATNLATQYPDVANNILALPLSPKKNTFPTDPIGPYAMAEDRQPAGYTSPSTKHLKDTHTPSKPNWALAPDSSPTNNLNRRDHRRPRSGKDTEVVKESELRHRRSRGRGQPRGGPKGDDMEGFVKNVSPSMNKGKTRARPNGPFSTRQSRARSSPKDSGSRGGTPSKNAYDKPQGDNLSSAADTRSALHLAQVDALIKQLQKTRGLMDSPAQGSGQRIPSRGKATPVRASSVSPVTTSPPAGMSQGQWVWVAGPDGVLRPGPSEQRNPSRLPPAPPPSAFLPAGMQFAHSQPMQRDIDLVTSSAPGSASRFGTGPRRSLEPRLSKDTNTPFPSAFHGPNSRIPEANGTVGKNARRSRTSSSQAPTLRIPEDAARNWRSAKLSKNPSPAATRGPSPSPISPSPPEFGQSQRWPTLDEICAMKTGQ